MSDEEWEYPYQEEPYTDLEQANGRIRELEAYVLDLVFQLQRA